MKIYLESNSYYLAKEKIDFLKNQFDLQQVYFLDLIEDLDMIKNLFAYNLLNEPILYVVDIDKCSKLSEKNLQFLISKKCSNYICFKTSANTSKNINKIKICCEFEYINKATNRKEDLKYLVNYAQIKLINIDGESINYLYKITSNNLDLSINELNKLFVYYQSDKISKYEIDLFVRDVRQDSMFDFYKIVFTDNKAAKLKYINSFIDTNEIIPVFNGLKNYVFLSYEVKLLQMKNVRVEEAAKKLKRNLYYITNIYNNVARLKITTIEEHIDKIIDVDLKLKQRSFVLKNVMYSLL